MDVSTYAPLLQSPGPFATVLVDASRDSENGEHEHELHVRAAAEQLREAGASAEVVDRVRERLLAPTERPAPVSRLVVADTDDVLVDELTSTRADQPVATWAPLPDLSAHLQHRDSAVTFVLAVVDHEGGDVALYDSDVPDPQEENEVGGETRFVHQVPVGGWSALHYQHNTEDVWARNAEAVVEEITGHLRRGHRLVLLAGDPQSRGIVRSSLADTEAEVVELESGTRAEDGGDEALAQAIREALLEHTVSRRLALTHELKERLGRAQAVATGVADVADAFVRGQVDTLLLDPQEAAEHELDPARHPGLALGAATPEGPVRADLALVAAAIVTGASVSVSPRATLGGAPVAALLRWHQDAEGTRV